MKVTIKYTNRKRKNKHGFKKRMSTKAGRALLARRRKKGRKTISAQLKYSLSSSEFSKIMETSRSLYFGGLSLKYTKSSEPEMGLIVSKRYGNAIERNLFKRRCRSAFKSIMVDNNVGCILIVCPKRPGISFKAIQESFNSVYDKISD